MQCYWIYTYVALMSRLWLRFETVYDWVLLVVTAFSIVSLFFISPQGLFDFLCLFIVSGHCSSDSHFLFTLRDLLLPDVHQYPLVVTLCVLYTSGP